MEDPAKRRREYLWRRTCTMIGIKVGLTLGPAFGITSFLCAFRSLALFAGSFAQGYSHTRLSALVWFGFAGLSGSVMYTCIRLADFFGRRSAKLSHVPPVSEQLAARPAAEVLLRGSDQPAAAPDELLRAAREGADTDAEESLRPDMSRVV